VEEHVVVHVEGVLPGYRPVLDHGVVPHDVYVGVRLYVLHEVAHQACELGVSSGGLLVDEPAFEPVVLGSLDQLVSDWKDVPVFLYEVPHPLDPPAVGGRGKEDRAVDGHAVPVGGVDNVGGRGEDEPLAGGAAPEDHDVDVHPVVWREDVEIRPALRRVAAGAVPGAQGGDPRLAGAGVGIDLDSIGNPGRERHG